MLSLVEGLWLQATIERPALAYYPICPLFLACKWQNGLTSMELGAKNSGTDSQVPRAMEGYSSGPAAMGMDLGNSGIHLGINYLVSNETKWNEYWLNAEGFRLVNNSFNTRNIHSKIGQIVTDLWQIFQQLYESFIILIAKFCKYLTYWVIFKLHVYK